MESIPSGDVVKIIELTTKDLEYYVKIVVKATARSDRTHFSFERNSTVAPLYRVGDSLLCLGSNKKIPLERMQANQPS